MKRSILFAWLVLVCLYGCSSVGDGFLNSSSPSVGAPCDQVRDRYWRRNASCGYGCGNSILACNERGQWICLPPQNGEVCVPIQPPPDVHQHDGAAPLDAVADAPTIAPSDVVAPAVDRATVPTDAPRRVAGGSCANGIGACARVGTWTEVRPMVFRCDGPLPALPSTERCDEIDNNCNGTTDEGCECVTGRRRLCYGGPANTWDIGICRSGSQACDETGRWSGSCLEQVTPRPSDTCFNQQDDDCDGQIDEDICADASAPR